MSKKSEKVFKVIFLMLMLWWWGSVTIAMAQPPDQSVETRAGLIDRLLDDGKLTVLVKENLPPFSMPDEDKGFDIDLAYAMADRWGIAKDDVVIQRADPANILNELYYDPTIDLVIGAVNTYQ